MSLRRVISSFALLVMAVSSLLIALSLIPGASYKYLVVVEESALGLMHHSPVYLGSVQSGYVTRIQNHPSNPNYSVITVCLSKKVDPERTIARIGSKGLIGPVGIMQLRTVDAPVVLNNPLPVTLGKKIIAQIPWEPSLFQVIYDVFGNLAGNKQVDVQVQEVLEKGKVIVEGFDANAIRRIISNLDAILQESRQHVKDAAKFFSKAGKMMF